VIPEINCSATTGVGRLHRPTDTAERKRGSMTNDPRPPEAWLYLALAFVGGYGDAASVVLAKTFTGHVTGNLVLASIAVAAHEWSALVAHLSAVLFFLVGVISSVLIERARVAWPFLESLPTVLGIEVVLTMTAYLALASRAAPRVEIFVVCVSLALGMQNGAFQRTGGIGVHTTYLTGMITRLMTAKAEKPQIMSAGDPKLNLLYEIWLAFFVGATVGAAITFQFKEIGILGGTFLLLMILICRIRARGSLSNQRLSAPQQQEPRKEPMRRGGRSGGRELQLPIRVNTPRPGE
jgi:uncharacterized membrane protein YoaK (UPF0700 family)